MNQLKNIVVNGSDNRPMLTDLFFNADNKRKPVVIFVHGFKGFKDWGCWDLVAKQFATAGMVFIKFNLSHNGIQLPVTDELTDLEAFSANTFSKELDDIGYIIDWVANGNIGISLSEVDLDKIYLVGHSRGGGDVILKAAEDKRVQKIVTWASIARHDRYNTPEILDYWQKEGVLYVENSRTKQKLPMKWNIVADYRANEKRLDIAAQLANVRIPHLIIHGTADTTVAFAEAEDLHKGSKQSTLLSLPNEGHTFDAKHPWQFSYLPSGMAQAVQQSIAFLGSSKDIEH
ncbi:MAG: hypothetical protein R2798_02905 [Chitinophagales bacterium]